MRCPFCWSDDTRVIDSRLVAEGSQVRRRRECMACAGRFNTHEVIEMTMPRVIKRSGARCGFDEGKLRAGVMRSLEKRPIASEAVELMMTRILQAVHACGEAEIESARLGELVMESLRELDQVAYVRFASVYRSFEDVDAFKREIEQIQSEHVES